MVDRLADMAALLVHHGVEQYEQHPSAHATDDQGEKIGLRMAGRRPASAASVSAKLVGATNSTLSAAINAPAPNAAKAAM